MKDHESSPYPPTLSEEEQQQLIEAAMARIKTVDTLDGWELPPDNEELWIPGTLRFSVGSEVHEHPRTMTNASVRAANISNIAQTGWPLYIKDDDPVHLRTMESYRARNKRSAGVVSRMLGKLAGS